MKYGYRETPGGVHLIRTPKELPKVYTPCSQLEYELIDAAPTSEKKKVLAIVQQGQEQRRFRGQR